MADAAAVPPLRTAVVGYLNARPLLEGLDDDPGFAMRRDEPSVVADRLRSGDADLGLVPVAEAARLGLPPVSDACVAAYGRVASVVLFLRTAPHRVRRAALDAASRTSRELARWYLRGAGASFETVDARPAAALADSSCDAVLAIGDDALRLAAAGTPAVDLAAAWADACGEPFVFAVWAASERALKAVPRLGDRLSAARDAGLLRLDAYAAEAAAAPTACGDAASLAVYLRKRLRYVLGPAERRGLRRFLREAGLPPVA